MTTKEQISELCVLTTRDEAGRHFSEWSLHHEELEAAGLIAIYRPIHEQTGVPYSAEYWQLEVTEDGLEAIDAETAE